uniref:Adenylate kinase n=1 Tax=Acrobeloides nanus TaxID=290746 RepID=A0A914CPF4_9BILA
MRIFPNAKAYFLEGYPIEINQVKEFERQFKTISSAIIMDYDEEVLKNKLRNNGLSEQLIKARINQFVQKLFPTTLYFYDQNVLHFVLGDKDDSVVYERIMKLVIRAMESNQPSTQVL